MTILTKLEKDDVKEILSEYNLGSYVSHKPVDALGNTIYFVNTEKGKFVLKIFEKAEPEAVKFQIGLIEYLQNSKIPVQGIIRNRKKESIFKYKDKTMVMHKFIDAKPAEHFSIKLLKNVADNIGKLHKVLLESGIEGGDPWQEEHQFNEKKQWTTGYSAEFSRLVKELKKNVDKKNLRRCIIHRDLSHSNLLVKNDKLAAFMDWDDSGTDFLAYDVAVFIAHGIKDNKKKLRTFFSEYSRHITLNSDEKKAVYYFIKDRYLNVANYLTSQKQVHDYKWLDNSIKWAVDGYKKYENMELEKFLENIS